MEQLIRQYLIINQAGFIYIYLSNESASSNYVFFDNLDVAISESPVLETTDYYPFGLTFNSYTKPGTIGQNFKYNGKEEVNDLGLNWQDFGARMYMPDLGRWGVVDNKAELFLSWSPYNYALNNPVRYEDIGGEGPGDRVKNAKKKVTNDTRTYKETRSEGWTTDEYADCSEYCREIALADGFNPGNNSRAQADYFQNNGFFTSDISEVEVGDFMFWKDMDSELKITHVGLVIDKTEEGKFQISQATYQKGGKTLNDHQFTNSEGTFWAGTDDEIVFVGAGRPGAEQENKEAIKSFTNSQMSWDKTITNLRMEMLSGKISEGEYMQQKMEIRKKQNLLQNVIDLLKEEEE